MLDPDLAVRQFVKHHQALVSSVRPGGNADA